MKGRMVHDEDVQFHAYGQRPHEVIYSISRIELNKLLLDAAEETRRVRFHFGEKVSALTLRTNTMCTL